MADVAKWYCHFDCSPNLYLNEIDLMIELMPHFWYSYTKVLKTKEEDVTVRKILNARGFLVIMGYWNPPDSCFGGGIIPNFNLYHLRSVGFGPLRIRLFPLVHLEDLVG